VQRFFEQCLYLTRASTFRFLGTDRYDFTMYSWWACEMCYYRWPNLDSGRGLKTFFEPQALFWVGITWQFLLVTTVFLRALCLAARSPSCMVPWPAWSHHEETSFGYLGRHYLDHKRPSLIFLVVRKGGWLTWLTHCSRIMLLTKLVSWKIP
jgi:hypothetical protein